MNWPRNRSILKPQANVRAVLPVMTMGLRIALLATVATVATLGYPTGPRAIAAAPDAPAPPGDEPLVPPRPRPNPAALREQVRRLTPEERQKWIRELRAQAGLTGTNRTQASSLREQLRQLPPAERAERLRQLRQSLAEKGPAFAVLTPEEREAKRKEIKERVDAQVARLNERKADGTITDVEQRRLQRMEAMSQRLGQGQVLGVRRPRATAPKETDPLPPPVSPSKENPPK